MATAPDKGRLVRWEQALNRCLTGVSGITPIELNNQLVLSEEKQMVVLDALEDALPSTRAKMAPIFRQLVAQWLVFDAMREAQETSVPLSDILNSEGFSQDLEFLRRQQLDQGGSSSRNPTAEEWMWNMLSDAAVDRGDISDVTAQALLATANEALKEGRAAQEAGDFKKAMSHYAAGLQATWVRREMPEEAAAGLGTYMAESMLDAVTAGLLKGKATCAFALGLARTAHAAADRALELDPEDHEAMLAKANSMFLLEKQGLKSWRRPDQQMVGAISGRAAIATPQGSSSGGSRRKPGAFSKAMDARLAPVPCE